MADEEYIGPSLQQQLDVLRPVLDDIKVEFDKGTFISSDDKRKYRLFRWSFIIDNKSHIHLWHFKPDRSITLSKMIPMFNTGVLEEIYLKEPVNNSINNWIDNSFKSIADTKSMCSRCHREDVFIRGKCNHCLEILYNHAKIDSDCAICLDSNFVSSTTLPCNHRLHEDCLASLCKHISRGKCPECRRPFEIRGYHMGWWFGTEYEDDE